MWLFCVLAFLDAICFEAFMTNTPIIYQQKFNMGIQQAGLILAIPCATIIILAPFLTIAFERCGKRCFYLMLGFIFVLASHLIFYSKSNCTQREPCPSSTIPLGLLGLGSAMIKLTLLPSLGLVTKERFYGPAFGMFIIFINLGVLFGSVIIGSVVDESSQPPNKYGDLHLVLACFSTVGLMVSTYICANDEIKHGRLNAVTYMEHIQVTPYESEDEPSEAENKDEVRSFGDLDIKHTK